jgi:hypothetical protein
VKQHRLARGKAAEVHRRERRQTVGHRPQRLLRLPPDGMGNAATAGTTSDMEQRFAAP